MRKTRIWTALLTAFALVFTQCYHPPGVRRIKNADKVAPRTLFIALDGIDYELVKELHDEGYFGDFLPPIPLNSTFPSDTTVGFTGILKPLDVGKVPGYEVRFYSYKDNKVIGGTPFDIYKIPIHYKYYFDSFRHQIHQKAIMYMFPGLAGKEDLIHTENVLMNSDKRMLMTYLGGTDGAQHLLGRARTKTFLKYVDWFLKRMRKRYQEERHEPLRIVLFSDHGFYHGRLKTITESSLTAKLKPKGFRLTHEIKSDRDVVDVTFGLLSAGVLFTPLAHREELAATVATVPGVDLVFWHRNDDKKIFVRDSLGAQAVFEYRGTKSYRYVPISGDPLGYDTLLTRLRRQSGEWITDGDWKRLTADAEYPDAGYRLYEAFFHLVENPANVMFSTKKDYQFGSMLARVGTWIKFGHKGTHGGLFHEASLGIAMTDTAPRDQALPESMRYDELFGYFLPEVTRAYRGGKSEISVVLSPEQYEEIHSIKRDSSAGEVE
jgi:hypothetical protein